MQTQENTSKPLVVVPEWNWLLIELVDVKEAESSIILDPVQTPHEYGRVVSAGPDVARFKAGDLVMFGQYSGYALVEEQSFLIRETDVMGRVEGGIVTEKKKRREDGGSNLVIAPAGAIGNGRR